MEKLLISACLLGDNTKYNGKNNKIDLSKILSCYELYKVCPEVDGGLSIPRDPSEIKDDKVISNKGLDVTSNYFAGAKHALDICKKYNIKKALLKEKSPSCGKNYIYDGTFSSTLIKGMGVTAKLLTQNGISVFSEHEIDKLIK